MQRGFNVISGQVYGKVDWIASNGREVGMFLKGSNRSTTRCIIQGEEVEGLIANNLLLKGMMASAHGEFSARCFHRKENNSYEGEVVCIANRIVLEPPREGRLRGAIYATLKGSVMYWDPVRYQLKTFFNSAEPGRPSQLTVSLFMRKWVDALEDGKRQRFLDAIAVGRDFTCSTNVEVTTYSSKGTQIPCLQLLPTDFRLQG